MTAALSVVVSAPDNCAASVEWRSMPGLEEHRLHMGVIWTRVCEKKQMTPLWTD